MNYLDFISVLNYEGNALFTHSTDREKFAKWFQILLD
jgi:hypothetical protein